MFRRGIWEALEEYVVELAGNSVVAFPADRIPIGTCGVIRDEYIPFVIEHSHPISFLGERVDHQLLILLSPFSHTHIRADDRIDILDDVFCLPSLIVKRHATGSQRLYNSSDVDFWATGNTYTKMWEGKFDELLHEI